ncbi:putative acyl-CoA dehydrogenase [Gemmobacter megaterium]|uniref:Putative acyl-CoA dehydrogenase n=1 Tax=Gemmobacter megaterium TaxID=1086013 RepID=A0A1N7NQ24_9RHOB|nr:acyl-CoA dehydrogenase family protein [Gemmobacter megaterium]GGE17442.1 acyl-CoA dehydrogenase [Gemmobacter megaterium]SIT00329.1 putative acyl-CoA dehydrogenase [Gemmobacter megaterium]
MPHAPRSHQTTHEVFNQPTPAARDLWASDPALRRWAGRAGTDSTQLARFGARAGAEDMREAGRLANRHLPELRLFDRTGRRLDEVVFHPAYHQLMDLGLSHGYAACAWDGTPGGHATHAAMLYMLSQVEPGVCCPMTMTYAAVPALAADPALAAEWQPRLTARAYDPAVVPLSHKRAATMGMAMTEKQGGSDVRANTTTAQPDGEGWRLTGHKWFCSAPMCDGFLTLAQAPGGLTCFVVPRWTPDGERNALHIQRLKDKLGNRANASSEIEYHNAWAHQLGPEGQGVRTIIEMVQHTRLDTAMAPAGLMRGALAEALWWANGRSAFQRRLIDQPLMRAVLADLAVEAEGALAMAMRVARAFDDPAQTALARIAVAVVKFWSNKRCIWMIGEAMECLGGMGYVEDTPMPMLYREAPLNGIWEGSGNVICLDILRALAREPAAAEALRAELMAATGADRRYDAALRAHLGRWPGLPPEAEARLFAERLAVLFGASVLLRDGQAAMADAWIATRVEGQRGALPGAVSGIDTDAILAAQAG